MAALKGKVESLHKKRDSDNPKPTFGFIKAEDGQSVFFLPTSMQMMSPVGFDDLRPGMTVEYTTIDTDRGPRAIEVIVIDRRIGGRDASGPATIPTGSKRR